MKMARSSFSTPFWSPDITFSERLLGLITTHFVVPCLYSLAIRADRTVVPVGGRFAEPTLPLSEDIRVRTSPSGEEN
jgi:hypothetical protein